MRARAHVSAGPCGSAARAVAPQPTPRHAHAVMLPIVTRTPCGRERAHCSLCWYQGSTCKRAACTCKCGGSSVPVASWTELVSTELIFLLANSLRCRRSPRRTPGRSALSPGGIKRRGAAGTTRAGHVTPTPFSSGCARSARRARHRIRRVPYIGVPRGGRRRAAHRRRACMQRGQLIGGPQARVPLYVPYADFFQYQAGRAKYLLTYLLGVLPFVCSNATSLCFITPHPCFVCLFVRRGRGSLASLRPSCVLLPPHVMCVVHVVRWNPPHARLGLSCLRVSSAGNADG